MYGYFDFDMEYSRRVGVRGRRHAKELVREYHPSIMILA